MPIKSIQLQEGQKFNKLTIVKLHHIEKYTYPNGKIHNQEFYLCKCDCGKEVIVVKYSLKNGNTQSCGCYQKEKLSKLKTIHGLKNHKLYGVWKNIKIRCYNKNDKDYGGRGITICEEWLNDFMSFYNWAMDNGYKENEGKNLLSIDRIDNNDNYYPENCRWTTMKEQGRNRRNNHLITCNGETHCLSEWAEILGIKIHTLKYRLNNWSIEKVFNNEIKDL